MDRGEVSEFSPYLGMTPTQNSEVRRLSAQLEGMKAELSSRVQSAEERGAEGNT